MNVAEKWLCIDLVTLALAAGHAAGHTTMTENAIWTAPFAISIVGSALWQYALSQIGYEEAEDVETGQPKIAKVQKMTSEEPHKIILLRDTHPQVTDPLTGEKRLYSDVSSPTLVAFAIEGWKHTYTWRKMHGMMLGDGMQTKVTHNIWEKMTSILAECHFIVAEPSKTTRVPFQPIHMRHLIRPVPRPGGWTGWEN
jgi:hypothetical protein